MKTNFPLFARLLLWFFINLVVLLVALFLTLRFEFGPQFGGFLPDTSRSQTQAMALVLINDLAKTPREQWGGLLSHLSVAYHLEFALFDRTARRVAGAPIDPPAEAKSMIMMTGHGNSPGRLPPPEGFDSGPHLLPRPLTGGEDGLAPPPSSRFGQGGRPLFLPEFPQRVIRSANPKAFWLLIHLPIDQLRMAGLEPMMLVGRATKVGESPLLFNSNPWFSLAAGMTVFSFLFWLPLTRDLTRAISRMTEATEAIAEGRFDNPVFDRRTDELGRLGFAINRMAARLKGFITRQRRFLGDVAHELCSPLARMELALGILEERSDEKTLRYVQDVREEVTHMRKLAHELLSFSQASLGENRIKLHPISIAEVVAATIQQEHVAESQVEIQVVPGELQLQGSPELVTRAVANLLRNALRYASHMGLITIRGWEEGSQIIISVADGGPGVPVDEIEKLFDPFYRIDESRRSETGGVGLGLAIVKTCVEACNGSVMAFNRRTGGLEVQLHFPKLNAVIAR